MASFSMARHVDAVVERLMHETPHLQLQALLLLSILALLLLHLATASRSTKQLQEAKRLRRPPSPPGLPVIGHLHLVGALPHVSLRDLAREHGTDGGGLMMLRLGVVPNLVVSSPPAAQAVMRTHDHLFASRPPSGVADLLLYGSSDIAFSTYGEHWRQLRKLVTTHLFTVKKVQSYRLARQQEVRLVIDKIRSAASSGAAAVDMSETMNTYVNDVVCRTVSGKFFRAEGRNKVFRELIQEDSILFSGFNLEDYFPRLAKLRLLNRLVLCKAEKISKRWDELLETIIRDHETKTVHRGRDDDDGGRSDDDEEQESDFIDVLLSVQQEYRITRDHVKAILMMDQNWMYEADHRGRMYFIGVASFMSATMAYRSNKPMDFICYSCVDCKNEKQFFNIEIIYAHLLRRDFKPDYTSWTKYCEYEIVHEEQPTNEGDKDNDTMTLRSDMFVITEEDDLPSMMRDGERDLESNFFLKFLASHRELYNSFVHGLQERA